MTTALIWLAIGIPVLVVRLVEEWDEIDLFGAVEGEGRWWKYLIEGSLAVVAVVLVLVLWPLLLLEAADYRKRRES